MKLKQNELKEFLEEKYDQYNRLDFIESDPISIPHQFTKKEDIEIAGFLAATIAWGQRVTIIKNANSLIKIMDNAPYEFVMNANSKELKKLKDFKHRTFNGIDVSFFIQALQHIYKNKGGLEKVLTSSHATENNLQQNITDFRNVFFSIPHPARTTKHISNPSENSSAKRLCMYMRWMTRKDKRKVDFGLWKFLPENLMCPLDVHSGNVARKLGLLKRTQNDWKAVEELTTNLKQLDAEDPVKYDFALFGLGVFERF
jgi:uncharacterized protein (TIGR02757 family)